MKLLYIIIFLLMFTSCNNCVKKSVQGYWAIKELNYKGFNITRCTDLNVINFNQKTCVLPRIAECDTFFERSEQGVYDLSKKYNQYLIDIDSDNKIFNGMHKVFFSIDTPREKLIMEIESPELYCIFEKSNVFQSPFINELECAIQKISSTR